MRLSRFLPILLLVCLAAPSMADPIGALEARQVRTLDPAVASGVARAIAASAGSGGAGAGTDLRITGESVTVTVNQETTPTSVVTVGVYPPPTASGPTEHRYATVATTRVGDLYDLTIVPAGAEATLESLGGTALPSADTTLHSGGHVNTEAQPPLRASVQATVLWEPTGDLAVHLEGDFAVAAWDWDLDVAGTAVRSGNFRDTKVGAAGVSVFAEDHAAEAFLQVRNGTLDLRIPDGRAARAYLAGLSLSTDGALALSGVKGAMPTPQGTLDLDGTIVFEGGVAVDVTAQREGLSARLVRADAVRADGTLVPLAATVGAGPAPVLPWLLGLAGAVPIVAAAWRSAHLRRARRVTLLRMDAGRYELALHGSRGLLRSRRHRIFARTVRTVALLRLGRPAEARQLLDERHWRGPLAASRLYLLAHASALEGDRQAADRYLQAGLALDGGLRADAASNPTLRPLLDRAPVHREGYT